MHTFRSRPIYVLSLLLVGLVVMLALPSGRSVAASTFTVNSPADVVDETPGDGKCETHLGNGVCTLRAAIQEANALAGTDTINLKGIKYTLSIPGIDDVAAKGDLDITESVNIVGAGQGSTIIDGNGSVTGDRVFQIQSNQTVSMSGLTITGGKSSNIGGGMINNGTLTLDHVTITENRVAGTNDWGGGIFNSGTLTITNSTISGNTTGNSNAYGGGIMNQGLVTVIDSTISGNTTPNIGGGLYSSGPTVTIKNSTISGNTAANGGGIYQAFSGAAIVIDSTVSGNFSTVSGGGIYNDKGTTSLFNATVANNQANSDSSGTGVGGGVLNVSGGTVNFANTIIAGNTEVFVTGGQFNILNSGDCAGTLSSQGNNIIQDWNDSECTINGAYTHVDPQLGSLQNNGGPTQTEAIPNGSPAIDAGNAGGCTDNFGAILTTDQRGDPRAVDGDSNGSAICDIGAFEYQGAATPTPTPSPSPSGTATPSPTSTSTLTPTPTPTPTPTGGTSGTPTPTSTPTPTVSHTPTPTSSNPAQLIEGDLDCNHTVNARDALSELDFLGGLNPGQHQPCPAIDSLSPKFGDLNCDNSIDGRDITKLLRHLSGAPDRHDPPCPDIGQPRG